MDLIVFSHLRWDFVYQRPQHLISRFARQNRVWFFEEPVFGDHTVKLEVSTRERYLTVCKALLPHGLSEQQVWALERQLLNELISTHEISDFATWYYTPMALEFSRHLQPEAIVYDCMDELSGFRGAPPGLRNAEAELFRRADVVFTGGQSIYESKKQLHPNVHAFPSSIDASHFNQARQIRTDPEDQAAIPHPRLGFAGVIDERLDIPLLRAVATQKPDWHFVMIGPVVKIKPEELPQLANIHYLGPRDYKELPAYLAGWDIGILPFARNESTRFISPTKTPEYLAAGLPVVSTYIRDVVRPYGQRRLVRIANDPLAFVNACKRVLPTKHDQRRIRKTDEFLATNSWEKTWQQMNSLLCQSILAKSNAQTVPVVEIATELPAASNANEQTGEYV